MDRATFLLCAGLLCGAALLGCPAKPSPEPPPTTTTTTLAPTPDPACYAPTPGPAGDYVGVPTLPPEHLEAMIEAREAIGRHRCWPSDPGVPLELLAAWLRAQGLCAVRNEDRVLVDRSDAYTEEWHMARWSEGPYRGCWTSMERAYIGTLAWIGAAE